jgi:hypothetical protein
MLQEYRLSEIEYLKINGRTTEELEPLTLFWTGSGFELKVKAAELWVEIEADYDEQEPWFSVLVNGAHIARQMAVKGRNRICLFRSRNPEEIKHVKFVKDSQAMGDDEQCCLQIHSIFTDGTFCPVEDKPYKLEFIGDSITSGEGTFGAKEEQDWVAMFFSGVHNYAAFTAEVVNADFRIISQSGWGVFASWDGQVERALPDYYEKVCGVLKGSHNEALGAQQDYDFTKWQPDAVIVNLGTNDGSAFSMPEFHHELVEFENAVTAFLKKLRRCNPKAELVWVYGMLGYGMTAPINRGIQAYVRETGDERVHFLNLPNTTKETVGSREHPGIASHKKAAAVLADYLKCEILK